MSDWQDTDTGGYFLCACTRTILSDIEQGANQKTVAITYALSIRSAAYGVDKPDWPKINRAIIDRWSMSGLERVKGRAFSLLKGKIDTAPPPPSTERGG